MSTLHRTAIASLLSVLVACAAQSESGDGDDPASQGTDTPLAQGGEAEGEEGDGTETNAATASVDRQFAITDQAPEWIGEGEAPTKGEESLDPSFEEGDVGEIGSVTQGLNNCRTYTGTCTGIWWGRTCASGEGWRVCSEGSSHYAFLTICGAYGSYPSSYGVGYCWF